MPGGFEAADEILHVRRTDKASLVVPFLVPGVGKVDVKAIYAAVGHVLGQEHRRIGADDSHVGQAPSAYPVDRVAVVPAGPFDPEEVVIGRL